MASKDPIIWRSFAVAKKGTLNWSRSVLRNRYPMSLGFTTGNAQYGKRLLNGGVAELGNAVIAFFWEGKEPRMGTLTVTLPDRSSSHLLGDRDRQLGLILGSQLAALTGKMTLVSVNLPVGLGDKVGKTLLELAQGLVGREGGKDG